MSATLAVLDAAPIIAFHQIDRLEIVRDLFTDFVTAPSVAHEVAPSVPELPNWIAIQAVIEWPRFKRRLGSGEQAAIALSIQLAATVVVLDDLDARSEALDLRLSIVGSLGLLVRAKNHGLIRKVQPLMDGMIANGLYVSENLYHQILTIADERL